VIDHISEYSSGNSTFTPIDDYDVMLTIELAIDDDTKV
jgi:hypothetical protein